MPKFFIIQIDSNQFLEARYEQTSFVEKKQYNKSYIKIDGMVFNFKNEFGVKEGMWLTSELSISQEDPILINLNDELYTEGIEYYYNGNLLFSEQKKVVFKEKKIFYYVYPNNLWKWNELKDGELVEFIVE